MGIQTHSNFKVDKVGFRQELGESKPDILEIPVQLLFSISVAWSSRCIFYLDPEVYEGF